MLGSGIALSSMGLDDARRYPLFSQLFCAPAAAHAFMSVTSCGRLLGPFCGMFPPYHERQLVEVFVNGGFAPPTYPCNWSHV